MKILSRDATKNFHRSKGYIFAFSLLCFAVSTFPRYSRIFVLLFSQREERETSATHVDGKFGEGDGKMQRARVTYPC